MRVSTMIRINAAADGALIDRITDFGRQAEARGFPGVWIGDSMGRGRPTLDSLQVLTALAAVTSKVDLGSACCNCRCAIRSNWRIGCNRCRLSRTTA
jgi:alkanesulfonate monooxygenase SsuD/methylene tetrahydromethanopterin reductase-like flavin-dependent oxidoreductase (luciferase family)